MRALGHAEGSEDAPSWDGDGQGSRRKQITTLRFWHRNQTAPIVLTGLSGDGTTTGIHTRLSGESAEVAPTDIEDGRSRKSFSMALGKAV